MKRIMFAALAAVGGCSGGTTQEKAAEPVALIKAVRVEAAPVESTVPIYGSAEASPGNMAVLSAPADAIVAEVTVAAGAPVARGQVVARLAPSPTSRLELARAASDARAARSAYQRAVRLRADGLVGDAEVEQARAAAQTSSATQASLAARAGALALRAPLSGRVALVSATPGSLVPPGTPIMTISGAGDLRARFGVDPTLARQAVPGGAVRITPSAGGASFTVPILSVDPAVDPQTRLASIFTRIPAGYNIGVGEPLTGALLLGSAPSAPSIPYAALLDDGGQPYVFVVRGGKAFRRNVLPGPSDGRSVAIQQGLNAGEFVVTEGGTALSDGMQVRTR